MSDIDISVAFEEPSIRVDVQDLVLAVDVQEALIEVTPEEALIEVDASGPAGPRGADGVGAALELPFAFGDATPALIATVAAGKRVYAVALHVTTAFDGASPSLRVGDSGDFARLMAVMENDPSGAATYESNPNVLYGGATPIYLSIVPGGGATAGAGIVQVYIQT